MLEYKDGILSFNDMMRFYIDDMIRDNVIVSIPSFFQQVFRISKNKKTLNEISNSFGKDKLFQVTKDTLMDKVPAYLTNIFTQEKYFCVKSYSK